MRPLVLIPGLGNTQALFVSLLTHMPDQQVHHVNLIAPDVQDFDGMLCHVRPQLPAEPFDLLGFSMGGYVSLALALAQDTALERLILMNTRAVDDDPDGAQERARTLRLLTNPKTRFEGMTPALFKRLVAPPFQDDEEMFELVREMALGVGRDGLAAQIRANQTRPNMLPDLAQITQPTLILAGGEDGVTPPDQSVLMQAGIPGSQLTALEGCGHLGPLERPGEMAALIQAFLA